MKVTQLSRIVLTIRKFNQPELQEECRAALEALELLQRGANLALKVKASATLTALSVKLKKIGAESEGRWIEEMAYLIFDESENPSAEAQVP